MLSQHIQPLKPIQLDGKSRYIFNALNHTLFGLMDQKLWPKQPENQSIGPRCCHLIFKKLVGGNQLFSWCQSINLSFCSKIYQFFKETNHWFYGSIDCFKLLFENFHNFERSQSIGLHIPINWSRPIFQKKKSRPVLHISVLIPAIQFHISPNYNRQNYTKLHSNNTNTFILL